MQYEQMPLFPLAELEVKVSKDEPSGKKWSVQEAAQAFHRHMLGQGQSRHTIRSFDSDLRLLARYVGAETAVRTLDTDMLVAFLRYLQYERGIPCKPKSLARRVTTLKVFFSWLAEAGATSDDPATALAHGPVQRSLPRVLSDGQVRRLLAVTDARRLDAAKPDARPHLLVTLLLNTGIKKGECMSITLEDIDTSEPTTPSVLIRYKSSRDHHKQRELALPTEFSAVLAEYLAQYEPVSLLFECTARNLEYVLEACGKRADLEAGKPSFQTLRWTSAVRDFYAGMEEDALRQKLGLSRVSWAETLRKLKELTTPAP
jgi:integrase/recombinase XerD